MGTIAVPECTTAFIHPCF